MKVYFLPLAQKELDDAFAWYGQKSESLALEFLDELDRAIRRSVMHPGANYELEQEFEDVCWPDFPMV